MSRHLLTVNLKNRPSIIDSYRQHHERVWPEVLQSLRAAGIENMNIYLLGRQLVMLVDVREGLTLAGVFAEHRASSPRVAEWERLMQSLQEPSPLASASEWWTAMEPVFSLEDQEPAVARDVEQPDRS
jgi:L-rhamnose mutarotase